jgi:DNA repair protein RadA/Sms
VIHCLGSQQDDARRRTLRHADQVWTLVLKRGTLSIENRLYITKARNDAALTEPVKLRLTDQVMIDTSRDIA